MLCRSIVQFSALARFVCLFVGGGGVTKYHNVCVGEMDGVGMMPAFYSLLFNLGKPGYVFSCVTCIFFIICYQTVLP